MSYCRWSSDGFRCDVYAYEHVDGGVTVHVAGCRQRLWYNLLGRGAERLRALGRRDLWVEDPSRPRHTLPNGETYPALRLKGGWWRWPAASVLSWIQQPRLPGKPLEGHPTAKTMRPLFWWPYAWTHRDIGLASDGESRYGLGYGEAADYLTELRSAGYWVPQHAIDALREEEATDPEAAFRRGPEAA